MGKRFIDLTVEPYALPRVLLAFENEGMNKFTITQLDADLHIRIAREDLERVAYPKEKCVANVEQPKVEAPKVEQAPVVEQAPDKPKQERRKYITVSMKQRVQEGDKYACVLEFCRDNTIRYKLVTEAQNKVNIFVGRPPFRDMRLLSKTPYEDLDQAITGAKEHYRTYLEFKEKQFNAVTKEN